KAPITAPRTVLRKRGLETSAIQPKALDESAIEYCGAGKSVQCAAKPFLVGHAKTRLRSVQDAGRQTFAHGFTQHDLPLTAEYLERRRQADCKTSHSFIQQRHPRFDAVRHGGTIDLSEKLRRQLQRNVRQEHLLHRIGVRESRRAATI